jgi:hypothetical protein
MTTTRLTSIGLVVLPCLLALSSAGLQAVEQKPDGRFHDELLDHLVDHWDVTGTAHGRPTTSTLEAEWVFNHQFLRVHQRSVENIPEINAPFEAEFFIGYDHANHGYVAHFASVWGGDDPTEGLLRGARTGNELKLLYKAVGDQAINQRFIWEPESKSWHILSAMVNAGKEGEPFLDLKATSAAHAGSGNP